MYLMVLLWCQNEDEERKRKRKTKRKTKRSKSPFKLIINQLIVDKSQTLKSTTAPHQNGGPPDRSHQCPWLGVYQECEIRVEIRARLLG